MSSRPMDCLSEGAHRRDRPCKGLLIIASVLSCWSQPTSVLASSITAVPSPPYGMVGSNVTLTIQGFLKPPWRYTWYRKSTDPSNEIASYVVRDGVQTPATNREKVFANGSLLIPNLTFRDNDDYIVQVFYSESEVTTARAHLQVFSPRSRMITAGILIGVVAKVALIGSLIYVLCIRKTGGASRGRQGDSKQGGKIHLAQKESENSIPFMNKWLQVPLRLAQGHGSSSLSSAAPSENIYQTLEVTQEDIYEKIIPRKKPQAQRKGRFIQS
ncbi:carcinoembryonic antigen-related cell adhesion molecule 4-like [Monodelphis domestica]|uniref:Carcinoembryonic antigen-related cell adhesion molecule 4-like n=1 Tax=Monodelphis domestica TaxID=13616 RepID=K7DZJ4_MONDO|nr:carcinoembryonic antigen-related cell adhesion molecule 4-like [Monodelphis domestica]